MTTAEIVAAMRSPEGCACTPAELSDAFLTLADERDAAVAALRGVVVVPLSAPETVEALRMRLAVVTEERDALRVRVTVVDRVASGTLSHLYRGECPEYAGDPIRDADCPLCAVLSGTTPTIT